MLDVNSVLKLNEAIVLRGLADKFWALDTASGSQYRLNDVSYFVLNLLRDSLAVEQVVDEVLKEYAVSREQASADCFNVLRTAVEKGIVKEVKA